MYIYKALDENKINKLILKKLKQIQKNNHYTINQILNYLIIENPPIFRIIFGKMLCSYFEKNYKSYSEDKIINAKEQDFLKYFTLEDFFYQNENLKNDFHNDFEKYKKAIHEVARKANALDEYQSIKRVEDFNFSLYVLNAMYKQKSLEKIYIDIMSKKSGIENIDKLFQNFKESQKKLNTNKVLSENFRHIYKVYNPLFSLEALYKEYDNQDKLNWDNYLLEKYQELQKETDENTFILSLADAFIEIMNYDLMEEDYSYFDSFLIDYYAYSKGKQIKGNPKNKIDEEFIFIIENKDNLEEYFRSNRFVLGIFCTQYLKYVCDLECKEQRDILEMGKQAEDTKKLIKQIKEKKKNS